MSRPAAGTPPGVGRPRRFDDETERRLLMDAAMKALSRRGYAGVSVADVLSEAGLSTRAFYRHFDTREALLGALVRRDSESVGRSLERATGLASGPVDAVQAWLERYLDVFYEPRRAARTALLASPAVTGAVPLVEEWREMRNIFCGPLIEALRAGQDQGVLRSARPEADAYSMFALVTAVTISRDALFPDRAAARAHVMRYAWPALGLAFDG